MQNTGGNQGQFITEDDVKSLVAKYGYGSEDIQSFEIKNASDDKVLGFMAEYWNLKINVTAKEENKLLSFFIKCLPTKNEAKTETIKAAGFHDRELVYYRFVNSDLQVLALKPWCAKFVTAIGDTMVMEDLTAHHYTMRNKYEKFDKMHTLQALKALARLHASTIIYEEKRSKELQRPYRIIEDRVEYKDRLFYSKNNFWFTTFRDASLEIVKTLSKYSQDRESLRLIEDRWVDVWNAALELPGSSCENRSVICHRDLWNNNFLFHYEKSEDDTLVPDDCLMVDYQMISYQPPASDLMYMLHGNLDPQYRKENLAMFLNFYYDALQSELANNDVEIQNIMTRDSFMKSAKEYNQWGLIAFACVAHLVWPTDDTLIEVLADSKQYDDMMFKNRKTFVTKMMHRSDSYRKTIMGMFEEIADEYILNQ